MTGEEQFLRGHFQKFYQGREIEGPPEISSREFGYGVFGRKIANRNLAFQDRKAFNQFLRDSVPFFVSYSNALYKFPARRPMEAKEFLGGDLVYEFDADDLPTDCKQAHDSWECLNCGRKGKGRQLKCDECGFSTKMEEWFCSECLEAAKSRVFALLTFLEDDFGFTEGIAVNFSGRAGYHVHIRNDMVRQLSPSARIELIDYLMANGLNIFSHFQKEATFFRCSSGSSGGWPQRILEKLGEVLEEGNAEKIAVMGNTTVAMAKRLLKEKAIILSSIRERQVIPSIFGRVNSKSESKSDRFWQHFLNSIVAGISPIDRQTSVDLNKIVRVPETLHGETGFVSTGLTRDSLRKFNPFDDSPAFSNQGTVRVFINRAPRIYLAGESFGPFKEEEVELPLNPAIFLLGRGSAALVDKNEA
jgi:DNA primase small subunit